MTESAAFKERLELTRLLAKFKLAVRRQLNQSVNLERLRNEPDYAREQLAELEEQVDDEELLVLLLSLRERLVPQAVVIPPAPVSTPRVPAEPPKRYVLGVRG